MSESLTTSEEALQRVLLWCRKHQFRVGTVRVGDIELEVVDEHVAEVVDAKGPRNAIEAFALQNGLGPMPDDEDEDEAA